MGSFPESLFLSFSVDRYSSFLEDESMFYSTDRLFFLIRMLPAFLFSQDMPLPGTRFPSFPTTVFFRESANFGSTDRLSLQAEFFFPVGRLALACFLCNSDFFGLFRFWPGHFLSRFYGRLLVLFFPLRTSNRVQFSRGRRTISFAFFLESRPQVSQAPP